MQQLTGLDAMFLNGDTSTTPGVMGGLLYAFSDLPLADFKRVGKTFRATLNDAVLAVCAGALRRYLMSNGGVPDRPLVVCVPASLRGEKERSRWENHASTGYMDEELDVLLEAADKVPPASGAAARTRKTSGRRRGNLRPADEQPTRIAAEPLIRKPSGGNP